MAAPDRPDPNTPLPCFWIEVWDGGGTDCPYAVWIERATRAPPFSGVLRCSCDG